MKKLIFTTIICLIFTEIGQAQIRFGVRASGSMTNITEVHANSRSRGGFQVAALGLIPITHNDILFFQPEVNYSAQGENDEHNRPEGREKQKIFVNYINVPLHVKVYFTDAESEFFAEGGPYFGFNIAQKTDEMGYSTEADDNEYSGFDFGATLGIGFSLNRQIEASLRYSYGFVDQVKNDALMESNHTSILNLGISYFFN